MVFARTAALGVAFVVVAGCAHGGGFEPIDLDALPRAEQYPSSSRVVLFDRRTVELKTDEDGKPIAEETWHHRVRLLSEAGREHLRMRVFTDALWVELLELEARVTPPGGGEPILLTREDALDEPSYGVSLYADDRVLSYWFDEVPLGSVVEWRARTRASEPRLFTFSQSFERGVPVLESSFEVIHPPGWSTRHVAMRLDETVELPLTEETLQDGRVRRSVVRRDLAPLPWERLEPALYTGTVLHVMLERWVEDGRTINAFDDEQGLSAWVYERTDERALPTPEITALASRILEGCPDEPREKAKRLYAWTRDNIAYCAITIGYGGWFPHEAADTERLRYGDCKDKANLLRALLRTQNIDSHLAAIYAHDGFPRPFALPTLASNFNHEILVIDFPDGRVAIDPTTRTVPFGRLPPSDQGALLLPTTREGAKLWRTPLSSAADNVTALELDLSLTPGEPISGTFEMVLDGAPADDLRYALLASSGDGKDEAVDARVPVYTHGVSDVVVENEAPPLDPIPLVARGTLEGARRVERDWSRYLFRFSTFVRDAAPSLSARKRRHPVVLGVPETRHDRVRFRLPANAVVSSVPAPVSLESPFGRYSLTARLDDDALVFERSFVRDVAIVPAKDYRALKRFFDDVAAAESRVTIIRFRQHK